MSAAQVIGKPRGGAFASDFEEPARDGLTKQQTVASFVIACVGAGVVLFPRVMADVGYLVAPVLLAICSLVCCECGLLLAASASLAETISGAKRGALVSYEAIAEVALGSNGKWALTVSKNFYMLGLIVVYASMETDAIHPFLAWNKETIRWCLVAPVFVCLSLLRDLKQLARFASIGVFAAFLQCGAIALGAATQVLREIPDRAYVANRAEVPAIGASLATFVFGFGATVATAPSVRGQMAQCEQLPSALRLGTAVILWIYVFVMIMGYTAFGQKVEDNIIRSIALHCEGSECIMSTLSSASIVFNLLMSVPTFLLCATGAFESTGTDAIRMPLSPENIVFRISLTLALVFVSSILPYAKQVVNLISAVFGCCNVIFFPLLIFYSLRRRLTSASSLGLHGPAFESLQAFGPYRRWSHGLMGLIGLVAMVYGVIGGLKDLAAKLEEEQHLPTALLGSNISSLLNQSATA